MSPPRRSDSTYSQIYFSLARGYDGTLFNWSLDRYMLRGIQTHAPTWLRAERHAVSLKGSRTQANDARLVGLSPVPDRLVIVVTRSAGTRRVEMCAWGPGRRLIARTVRMQQKSAHASLLDSLWHIKDGPMICRLGNSSSSSASPCSSLYDWFLKIHLDITRLPTHRKSIFIHEDLSFLAAGRNLADSVSSYLCTWYSLGTAFMPGMFFRHLFARRRQQRSRCPLQSMSRGEGPSVDLSPSDVAELTGRTTRVASSRLPVQRALRTLTLAAGPGRHASRALIVNHRLAQATAARPVPPGRSITRLASPAACSAIY